MRQKTDHGGPLDVESLLRVGNIITCEEGRSLLLYHSVSMSWDKALVLEKLPELLEEAAPIRLQWDTGSRLKLDRRLPFLCVHRSTDSVDSGTARLLNSKATFLVLAPGENGRAIIEMIVEAFQPLFGSFLILELWSKTAVGEHPGAEFTIHPGRELKAMQLAESFSEDLRRITLAEPVAVNISDQRPRPEAASPLLSKAFREKHSVVVLGLEVSDFYQDKKGRPYPLLLRTFRRFFSKSLRRIFFEFVESFTTFSPPNFQTLGPRAMVKLVWQVDQELEEVASSFSFLLQVTPINVHQAWLEFKRSNYEEDPRFVYRPFNLDPTELKRKLYAIAIEKIEEPTFYNIFLEKQYQLDMKITMISRRRSHHFLYGSLSLYGDVQPDLSAQARWLLNELPLRARDADPRLVEAEEFAAMAQAEVDYYRAMWEGFTPTVTIREDLEASVMCDRGNLLIGSRAKVAASRVEPLLHHEVGTHLLTYYNGRAQPLRQLAMGLADYIEFQEGIAVLSEFLSGHLSRPRLQHLAIRVLAVENMIAGATLAENFKSLRDEFDFPARKLFDILARVYRGGGLTKDAVYLRGLVSLLDHLRQGGELLPLFVGKIARHHIPLIQELQWRNVLRQAPLQPRILTIPEAQERLEALRNGKGLEPLLEM